MPPKRILILGGTAEARDIAATLVNVGHDVTTSLAGVTSNPLLPVGKLRVGGFGGAEGLRDYNVSHGIEMVIDATHPFASIISNNVHIAIENTPTKLLRFERPAWTQIEGDHWIPVSNLNEAAAQLPGVAHVFITTGRKDLKPFLLRQDLSGVIRTVEPPCEAMPRGWRVVLDRPPHTFEGELDLFRQESFTHLVSKNAGGSATRAKLDAARTIGIPVLMVQRPNKPMCETFASIDALVGAIELST